ncbi:MAG: RbsD/FucU family protein [Bacteroidales bacterium]|nr:RbsD/FucU family protein [Bacteroidales bacterium]
MNKGKCINPCIMAAVSRLGHGDRILIADGNYPLASKTADAEKIWVSLSPGLPTVTDVLDALQSIINVEDAFVMQPSEGPDPEIFAEFNDRLDGMELHRLDRFQFYDECSKPSLRLAIATGEKRTFANLLITVGCA